MYSKKILFSVLVICSVVLCLKQSPNKMPRATSNNNYNVAHHISRINEFFLPAHIMEFENVNVDETLNFVNEIISDQVRTLKTIKETILKYFDAASPSINKLIFNPQTTCKKQ